MSRPGTSLPLRLLSRNLPRRCKNRSFALLFSGVLIIFTMVGVDGTLTLHMNTYFWELDAGENLFYFLAFPIGVMLGTVLARRMNELFDKKACIILGTSGWATLQIVPVVLRLLGWFPENDTPELILTLTSFRFFQGLVVAQSLVSFNSMIPDIVDEHELKTGKRQEGIFFAAISFSAKATHGLGTVVAGVALWLIDWPGGTEVTSAAAVTEQNIYSLGLVFGPVVALFAVASVVLLLRMPMSRGHHQRVMVELRAQRATNSGA